MKHSENRTMADFAKAIRYCHDVQLIDKWFSDFVSQHPLDEPFGTEEEIKLMMAVRILQQKEVVSRRIESNTLTQLAKVMRDLTVIEEEQEIQTEK
jgi:hypothetical protein